MAAALQAIPFWLDALLAMLVLLGTGFALIGSWGLARLSNFYMRLHGPTKATTLGVGCVLIASALWFSLGRGALSLHELLITLFLFMTAPVSAHLLVKAALRLDPSLRPPLPSDTAADAVADAAAHAADAMSSPRAGQPGAARRGPTGP